MYIQHKHFRKRITEVMLQHNHRRKFYKGNTEDSFTMGVQFNRRTVFLHKDYKRNSLQRIQPK